MEAYYDLDLDRGTRYENLYLLPGSFRSIRLSYLDHQCSSGFAKDRLLMANRGVFRSIIKRIAMDGGFDIVLMDLNPSINAFNQTLLLTSDYFLSPYCLDPFSSFSIQRLAHIVPQWKRSGEESAFPSTVKFLGAFPVRLKFRDGRILRTHQEWLGRIQGEIARLRDVMRSQGLITQAFAFNAERNTPGVREFREIGPQVQQTAYAISDLGASASTYLPFDEELEMEGDDEACLPRHQRTGRTIDSCIRKKVAIDYVTMLCHVLENMSGEHWTALTPRFRARVQDLRRRFCVVMSGSTAASSSSATITYVPIATLEPTTSHSHTRLIKRSRALFTGNKAISNAAQPPRKRHKII